MKKKYYLMIVGALIGFALGATELFFGRSEPKITVDDLLRLEAQLCRGIGITHFGQPLYPVPPGYSGEERDCQATSFSIQGRESSVTCCRFAPAP